MARAPVYCEPEQVRRAALEALDAFKSLDPRIWWKDNRMPLERDGSFHYEVRDKRSLGVCFLRTMLVGFNLINPTRLKKSSELIRLDIFRRGILLSILMHTQLWMRDVVLNERGEQIKSDNKRVLLPDGIFDFFKAARATNGRYDVENVRDLLEKLPVVAIPGMHITGVR